MKTLWMAEVTLDRWGQLVPIYAENEEEATYRAQQWAEENDRRLLRVIHFPRGFTILHDFLPGTQQETPE